VGPPGNEVTGSFTPIGMVLLMFGSIVVVGGFVTTATDVVGVDGVDGVVVPDPSSTPVTAGFPTGTTGTTCARTDAGAEQTIKSGLNVDKVSAQIVRRPRLPISLTNPNHPATVQFER
jgi:hypothetical protein